MPRLPIYLIYGNQEDKVSNKRYELIRQILPQGEEDGEVVDLRGPGNQSYSLDRAYSDIIQEMGTVSLIPDARRVVVVHELTDLRAKQRGSVREARKATAGKADYVAKLEDYLKSVMPGSDNTLIFIHNDDEEKNRRVEKSSPLFQIIAALGQTFEFSEKRIDWQLEEALLDLNLAESIALTREWLDRGGNAPFRLVMTLNTFLQLLLQARLESEARRDGIRTESLFPADMRPSIAAVPDFKAAKFRKLAPRVPLESLRRALQRLNDIQKSFFPTGDERVVHDASEQIEVMYLELMAG